MDPVDMELLRSVTRGNTEKIRVLFSLYLKQNGPHLEGLKQAIADVNIEQVRQKAHAMAGASAFLGATALAAPLFELERMGQSGLLEPQCRNLLALAEKEFALLLSFFNTL